MNILFLCGRNKARSPTAEAVFADVPGWSTASAGLSPDAEEPLSTDLVEWADAVFVMERSHRRKLDRDFGRLLAGKAVYCLDIADDYEAMDPELVEALRRKVFRILPPGS